VGWWWGEDVAVVCSLVADPDAEAGVLVAFVWDAAVIVDGAVLA